MTILRKTIAPVTLWLLLIFVFMACENEAVETDRDRTVRLLSNNIEKEWGVDATFIDDVSQPVSACDSSYILTMRSDFTWTEIYLSLICYQEGTGDWSLNESNDVITINYIDKFSGQEVEQLFEINELTEAVFEYQFVERNKFRRVRLSHLNE